MWWPWCVFCVEDTIEGSNASLVLTKVDQLYKMLSWIAMWDKEAKKLKTWRIITLFSLCITFICSLITVERNLKPYFTAVVSHPTVSFDHSELAPGTILLRQATIDICTTTESELTFINKDTTVIYNVAEMLGQVRQQAQGGAGHITKPNNKSNNHID